jgi:hypothetical protein
MEWFVIPPSMSDEGSFGGCILKISQITYMEFYQRDSVRFGLSDGHHVRIPLAPYLLADFCETLEESVDRMDKFLEKLLDQQSKKD